jgi:hypothetical protein
MSETIPEIAVAPEAPAAPEMPVVPVADTPRSPSEGLRHYYAEAERLAAEQQAGEEAAQPVETPEAPLEPSPFLELSEEAWRAGYHEALATAGVVEPAPDDPGYEDFARAEIGRLQQERVELLTTAAQHLGVDPHELADYVGTAIGQRNAAAAAEQQAFLARSEETAFEHINQLSEAVGAEYVGSDEVLRIARGTFADMANQYGLETAMELTPLIYEKSVNAAAAQIEGIADYGVEYAKTSADRLGRVVEDPVEVLNRVQDLFPRQVREHDGDEMKAMEASYELAVRELGRRPDNPRELRQVYAREARRIAAEQGLERVAPAEAKPTFTTTKQVSAHYAKEARRLARETR